VEPRRPRSRYTSELLRPKKEIVVTIPLYERVLSSDQFADLGHLSLADLRALRAECESAESAVSFARRILHGRIDIVEHERSRRQVGVSETLTELLDNLPAILTGSRMVGPTRSGRYTPITPPDCLQDELLERVDAAAGPLTMADIASVEDYELEGLSRELGDLERELSGVRRQLHRRIDLLQEEITVRYKRGEATLEGLLR
jgi:hypothetical protein